MINIKSYFGMANNLKASGTGHQIVTLNETKVYYLK